MMAWKVLKTRVLPIGVDLGSASVKMAQLRRWQGQLELTAAASADVPLACRDNHRLRMEFLADCLHSLARSGSFKGSQCVISLPADSTFVQHVRTAKRPPDELGQALRWELQGTLPFDPADAVIRHVVAGDLRSEKEPTQEVIVMAAAREVVEEYLQLVRRAKLDVVGLSVEPCAIMQCFARLFQRADDVNRGTLFLDLGQSATQVVIARGARMVFARNVLAGATQMDQAAAEGLAMTLQEIQQLRRGSPDSPEAARQTERIYAAEAGPVEALAGEVTQCLRYFESTFPSCPVERVVFLGGQALDRRLCQMLARKLNLPAQIGDPFARIGRAQGPGANIGVDRRQAQPAWAVAVGLCLGEEMPEAA